MAGRSSVAGETCMWPEGEAEEGVEEVEAEREAVG